MKKKLPAILLSFLLLSLSLFAEINLVSPVEGEWSNKQVLVIDSSSGADKGEYLYSVDGSDPQTFGFAYDGPVLLDVTGAVTLNVCFVGFDGSVEKTSVSYSVNVDNARAEKYKEFIQTFSESGILNYSAGSEINIPENLFYSMGLPPESFIPGRSISLSAKSVLTRYVPCTIWDKDSGKKWRFIIKTFPQNAGIYTRREVPFTITDWETITFTDNNLLYKVDDEYWGLPQEARKLDRSQSHTIYWQSLAFEPGNAIESFVLPAKPELRSIKQEDGSILYYLYGDASYTLSVLSSTDADYQELFSEIGVDVFFGDKDSGKLDFQIFSNSVYQGRASSEYSIDKKPPEQPQITASARAFYSREGVQVQISGPKGADLYIALSEPVNLERSDTIYTPDSEKLKNIPLGDFRKTKVNSFKITWGAKGTDPAYYKIAAYAQRGENKSQVAQYSVIIDQTSFYFDALAPSDMEEGTVEYPFKTFDSLYQVMQKTRSVSLKLKNQMKVEKEYLLPSNLEINGEDNASILFTNDGGFEIKGNTLEINKCRIEKQTASGQTAMLPLVKCENAVLTLKDCQISAAFAKNGIAFDSYNSILNFSDLLTSINAISYASFLSSVKSRLYIKNSSIAVSSETAVLLSANNGSISASDNDFSINGKSGRIAELFGVKGTLTNNRINAKLTHSPAANALIFTDSQSTVKITESGKTGN